MVELKWKLKVLMKYGELNFQIPHLHTIKAVLYSTLSNYNDPAVFEVWEQIESLVGSRYALSSKNYLIGLDETGKGEIIGHTVLTGVLIPRNIFGEMDLIIGSTDTKKRHKFGYWDELFMKLDYFRKSGFNFIEERIPPSQIDKYNINTMMDILYQRILSIFLREAPISECRIVIDDYRIGSTLKRFLNFLKKQGAEVVVAPKADDNYLEVKVASLISKMIREEIIENINENPEFLINNISVGTGNAVDLQTINWLKKWYASGKDWPWFVKRSFRTVREIEGKPGKIRKLIPPIKEKLLSKEFLDEFSNGRLSIQSLSLICSYCGQKNKIVIFKTYEKNGIKVSEIRCSNCKKSIDDGGLTLMSYCGYLVPDTSIIVNRLLRILKVLEYLRTLQ